MPPPRNRQGGVALLVVVTLVALGSTFLLLRSLNAATWRAERYRVTQEALVAAKEALVARAMADDNRPGSLPCPDTDDDGQAELFAGNQCPSYVGRLPWRTLDIPDLRDASGQRLWYVLSPTHRDHGAAEPINSNTVGQLTLTGSQPAANVLAILAAPGSTLIRAGAATLQDRSCIVGTNCDASQKCTTSPAALTPKCNPVNYLDISGGVDNAGGGNTLVSAVESETFNDRVLAIHADDVMPLVEKRVGRELAQKLREHYDAWQGATGTGFYPWAAAFVNPTSTPVGTSTTVQGLLPMSPTAAVWSSASAGCTGVLTNEITCDAAVIPPLFNISGTITNIGAAFFNAPSAANVSVDIGLTLLGSPTASWTVNSATETLNFAYSADILTAGAVRIRVRAPAASPWATSSWLVNNQWHHVAYYALSPAYALNGSGTGVTVSNTAAAGKEAIVLMTGRALLPSQSARLPVTPPASVTDYLEGSNPPSGPADLAFEQNFRNTGFNDQPVVVRP